MPDSLIATNIVEHWFCKVSLTTFMCIIGVLCASHCYTVLHPGHAVPAHQVYFGGRPNSLQCLLQLISRAGKPYSRLFMWMQGPVTSLTQSHYYAKSREPEVYGMIINELPGTGGLVEFLGALVLQRSRHC